MARRKAKFLTCNKYKYRFLTPSMCSVCPDLESCKVFPQYFIKNKRLYKNFIKETIEKFPDKYQLEVVFMATKQIFIQIVDKKTGTIESVLEKNELDALEIEDKILLTKGKELYIVTHKIEPVIRIELKPMKITEPITYNSYEHIQAIEIDDAKPAKAEVKKSPTKTKTSKKVDSPKPTTSTRGRKKKSTE